MKSVTFLSISGQTYCCPLTHSLTHSWLHGPLTAVVSFITGAHSSLSSAFCQHLLSFISRRSFSTPSKHLILGLPILLLPLGLLTNIFLTTFQDRCSVTALKSALQGKRLKCVSERLAYHNLAAITDCCGHQNARTVISRPIRQPPLTTPPCLFFIII